MIATIYANLLPLYILLVLGYVAGRYCDVNLHSLARVINFFLLPFVFFGAIIKLDVPAQYAALPLVTSTVSFTITFCVLAIAKRFYSDGTEYLLASSSVNANSIYFGLPMIAALFGVEGVSLYILLNMGGAINNASLTYYLSARGRFSVRESLIKLAKFPTIYALIAAALLNIAGIEMPEIAEKYWTYSVGAITILGMMMVGVSVSKLDKLEISLSQLSAMYAIKYIAWPCGLGLAAWLDYSYFQLFDARIYALMIILSVMPMTANLVGFAAEHRLFPERIGPAVLISCLVSVIIFPVAYWLIKYLGWA